MLLSGRWWIKSFWCCLSKGLLLWCSHVACRKNWSLLYFLLSKRKEPATSLSATSRMTRLHKWQKHRKFPLQVSSFSPQNQGAFWSTPNHNSSSDWKQNTERCSTFQSPNAALVYLPVYHESANTNCRPDPEQLSNYNFVIINYWVENHL